MAGIVVSTRSKRRGACLAPTRVENVRTIMATRTAVIRMTRHACFMRRLLSEGARIIERVLEQVNSEIRHQGLRWRAAEVAPSSATLTGPVNLYRLRNIL